jgi:predicted MFS family arabinose efflux permease
MAAVLAAVALAILTVAPSFAGLILGLIVGGLAKSISQPAANAYVVDTVPANRKGFALGLKQAAIPAAALLAGLAVPAIAISVGWRWAFALAVLMTAALILTIPPRPAGGDGRPVASAARPSGIVSLAVVALGVTLAAASANSLVAYSTQIGVSAGMSAAGAGILLAVGSLLNVATRLAAGWWSDKRAGSHYRLVSAMLAAGALGIWAMGTQHGSAFVVFSFVAFIAGWGWPGVFHLGVVTSNPFSPAAATGIALTGSGIGSALGPILFGMIFERQGRATALAALAAITVLAAGIIMRADHLAGARADSGPPEIPQAA